MKPSHQLDLYKKWNIDKEYTSIGLFRALKNQFTTKKVFYPGSYVHITPSLIFPDVAYADSFRDTHRFFEDAAVLDYVHTHKEYSEETRIRFFQQDYTKPFEALGKEFDLVISQYAGFVGQATKPYMKDGCLLVCNNSHGDASMASIDPDYELIAVYHRKSDQKFTVSTGNLDEYLKPKNGSEPTKAQLMQTKKGVAYTKTLSGYIFKTKR